ncbi:hydratase [Oscillospiraceae bacterium 38-13]
MITLHDNGVFLSEGALHSSAPVSPEEGRQRTLAWQILQAHSVSGNPEQLQIRFDAMASHDITYVGIIQQARASGMREFPLPYALTNCHNSLCAVGGTINEDDHVFGLSAARKYGGIYVPANQSVIHSYAREQLAGCGKMILGSDSHTRYGALGTMAVGEGGPELAKQLLKNTWDVPYPKVVLVYLTGAPKRGVGPHDVAIALVKATFESGFVNNCVLEFAGPGVAGLPIDFRNGIDVMTTETTCLSSIWETDGETEGFYNAHRRGELFFELRPGGFAWYDKYIELNLSEVEPMIALPFHPSNAWTIREFLDNAPELLAKVEEDARKRYPKARVDLARKVRDGGVWADQGVIAGCAGGLFDNITEAADILRGGSCGDGYFTLDVYPTSVPVSLELTKIGAAADLLQSGAVMKPSFCGPCFGAGDVPAHNGLSLRHTTRNFPNREGSKPGEGQFAAVCLMDARSIAATARNGGRITPATEIDYAPVRHPYHFDAGVYEKRVYNGWKAGPQPDTDLILGPNITDWPRMGPLAENLLVELAAVLRDPVTTTDELIPSGETSSYRSNPLRLAEFTLSRREPEYVGRAKAVAECEAGRLAGNVPEKLQKLLARADAAQYAANKEKLEGLPDGRALSETEKRVRLEACRVTAENTQFGSCVFANKPGDGSAREQAASCQKVLGGFANICYAFATKRYRSNCINWGILPFTLDEGTAFPYEAGDCIFVPDVRNAVRYCRNDIHAKVLKADGGVEDITLHLPALTADEQEIILDGCLMNYYAKRADPRLRTLPADAGREAISGLLEEWTELLAEEKYEEALSMFLVDAHSGDWTPELLESAVYGYGCAGYSREDAAQLFGQAGYKVTSLKNSPYREEILKAMDISSGYGWMGRDDIAVIHYDKVPLNGEPSDLTARFFVRKLDDKTITLAFMDLHVM